MSLSAVNAYERGIVTSSLTKTLGMCGLRLGWVGSRARNSWTGPSRSTGTA